MKTRIISAGVLIAIILLFIVLGGLPLKIFMGIVALLAYKEVISIKGIKNYPPIVVVLGLIVTLLLVYSNRDTMYSIIGLDYKYLILTFIIMFVPVVLLYDTKKYTSKDAFYLTGFIIFLGITLNLLMNILTYNSAYFWLILIVTVMTDTFAYFTGVAIGKHKVTKISPNKSLEGFIGGIIMGCAISTIYYVTFIGAVSIFKVILCMIFLSVMCEIGDLFYSVIKREAGIKDFSHLIPGHGGILDRLDSITFVTIAYVLISGII